METIESKPELQLHEFRIKKGALVLRAIKHPLRQQILRILHGAGQMSVTSLYQKLRLEQSVASQQLAILREAGFVLTKRDGKCILYSVNYNRLAQVHSVAKKLILH